MKTISRIEELEKKVWRIERLIWYIAGLVTIRAGTDIGSIVSAMAG